jgi:uncharacterized protein YggE
MTKLSNVVGVLLVSFAVSASAQQIQINKENKTIAITTNGQSETMADTAVLTVGFHVFGRDQDGTYADASRISNGVMKALVSSGVPKEAIQSASQALSPLDPDNESDKSRYAQGSRFEFSQSWHVTVAASAAANMLHVAILAGANDSGSIDWQLQSDDALEAQAASKALEHARQIAKQMAEGLGAKLGTLIYASNQSPPRGILAAMGLGGALLNTESASLSSAKRNLAPVAISPDRITRTATVYAVFAID